MGRQPLSPGACVQVRGAVRGFPLEFQHWESLDEFANSALKCLALWSGRQDSNLRPSGPKPDALPGCATPRLALSLGKGVAGRKPLIKFV